MSTIVSTSNVIAFVPRRPPAARETRQSPAGFLASALWSRIGATDLASYVVQSAIDSIVREIIEQARAEGERQASDRLTIEIVQLRAAIARGDGRMAPFTVERPAVEG